ncbi:MAG: hypothetical protein QM773_17470 [Hyphomonadaceae bacterium]
MNLRIGLATGVLLLASACGQSGAPAPVAAVPPAAPEAPVASSTANAEAPPTVGGVFVDKGACPGEGCHFGRMQAEKALDLYDAPGPAAKVIGQVAADEWMDTLTTEDRFAPVRGVVRKGGENFKAGDVVYRLGYEGEGCSTVWDKGQLKSWCDMGEQTPGDPGELIDWDTATPHGRIRGDVGAGEARQVHGRLAA